jgi:titin
MTFVLLAGLLAVPFAGVAVVVTAQAASAGPCLHGTLDSHITGAGNSSGVAVSGGHVYVADFNGGTVGEYTTTGATVSASFITGLNQPQDVAVSGSHLFVTNFVGGTVGEYDATTGATINASFISGLGNPNGLAVSGSHLFVADDGDYTVGEYDATTGATVNVPFITGLNSPEHLVVSSNHLFVANLYGNSVGEYDATTGATLNDSFITGLSDPVGVAVFGGNLFVANSIIGTAGEYDATTGATVNDSFITGLSDPQGVVVSGGDLFVANFNTGTVGEWDAATGADVTVTCTNALLSGGGLSGTSVSVSAGTFVSDSATLLGDNASTATGTVTYTVYSDVACTVAVSTGTPEPITTPGTLPASAPVALSTPGTYYWQASYSGGDGTNGTSASTCGSGGQVETVGPSACASGPLASLITGLNGPLGEVVSGSDLFVVNKSAGTVGEYTTSGATVNASFITGLDAPEGIALSGSDLFIVEGSTVSEYTTAGAVVSAPLITGLNFPHGVAVSGGDLFVVDTGNNAVGEYTTAGATVNAALITGLDFPQNVAVSGSDVFVTSEGALSNVGEYTTSGATVNAALITGLDEPQGVAVSGSDLFVVNEGPGTVGEYTTSGATVNDSLVTGLANPNSVVVSGSDLFVTNGAGGTVGEFDAGTGAAVTVTCTNTALSGGGQSGANVSVPAGTNVSESAALLGDNAATANGSVTYTVYSDAACTTAVSTGTPETITTPGTLPASAPVALATAGTYYWQATYSGGDGSNGTSASTCGPSGDVETVTAVVPGAPTGVVGAAGDGQVSLTWTAPANTGGVSLSNDSVSVFDGSGGTATGVTGAHTRLVGSTTTNFVFSGLTNGTAYTFEVAAVNSAGTGPLSGLSAPVTPVPAVSLYVTTTGSGAACSQASPCGSIQAAIDTAEGGSYNGDDVTVNVAAGTYTETDSIDASSLNSLTISGAGASSTTVNGNQANNVPVVQVGGAAPVTLSGLTITNGYSSGSGGGIGNTGTLTVQDSTITGNTSGDGGGGIFNGSESVLTVLDSTISGNTTNGSGGGIAIAGINCYLHNIVGCTTIITNSTISGNSAGQFGGGISNYAGTTIVTDSAISGNSAPVGAGIGNNYYYGGANTYMGATILANGTSATECAGNLSTDRGYNIADDSSCGFTATGSVNSSATLDASLGALANYGGPTQTVLPTLTSPAVGVIPTGTTLNSVSVCPRTDQRGVASVGNCTIGAVEVPPPGGLTVPGAPTAVSGTPGDGQVALGWSAPASDGGTPVTDYAVSVFNSSGGPATGVSGPTTRFVGSATRNFAFTGLTNGTAYAFTVAAVNSVGIGAPSALSTPVTPATVPGAPTGASAVGGVGTARVSFTAPGSNGGSAVTHYDVSCTSSNGGVSGAAGGSSSPVMVTGLSSGKLYSCTVTATNSAGTGSASSSSNSVVVGGSKLIPVGTNPEAVSSDGTHAWVANENDNSVTELDTSDGSFVQTISVGPSPDAISSDGTHVWVANGLNSTVTELNASNGSFVQTLGVGAFPIGISADGTHVWVANLAASTVTELNASDGSLVRTVNVGAHPAGVSSDGTHVWVTNQSDGTVTELNASDGSVVHASIPTGAAPTAVSSDGTHVWIANQDDLSVTELNASDGSLVRTITVGSVPVGVWSDGVRVWVAIGADNAVTELNALDGSFVRAVPVGAGPHGVVSDGVHVWVTNSLDNTVTELNAADTSLLAPGQPAIVSGTPSDGQVTVSWSPPASDGGSAITDYAVSVFNSSGGPATGVTGATTRLVGSNTPNFAFTGLTDETAYTFRVAAVNAVGTGSRSQFSLPFTPFTVPGAPTAVVGTSGNGQVSLSWVAPLDNGGSALTDYQVSVFDSGGGAASGVIGAANPRLVGSATTSYTFTGLTNATAYTFKVAAVNAAGAGALSALSSPIVASTFNVPAAPPNAVTGFDSGYAVNNSVTVGATGSWCPDVTPADCVGPAGSGGAAASGSLLPGAGCQYALVGRIGASGSWTFIGSSSVTLNGHGELFLAMNDVAGQFADNTGALQVSVAALDGVSGTTPPVSAQLTSGYDAAWTVPVINESGVSMTGVSATVHAKKNGTTPLGFDTALMPVGCAAGGGNSLVCPLPDVPAHSTYLFNVYVPTTGFATGATVAGDIAVSAAGGLSASGLLGTATIVNCGTACVVAVAPPGVPVSSSPPPATPAAPPQQTVTLPATQAGSTPEPVAVTLSTITPSASLPVSDQKLCPVAPGQTQCSGKISSLVADFSKYNDAVHPIRIKIVTNWGASVPAGRILMEKRTGGDPLFLLACQRGSTTAPYNTPCLLSETLSGNATNRTTTDTILMTGLDVHFARRVSTGGTIITEPAVPTGLTVTAGALLATLKWTAPTVTNGAGVTSYRVTVLKAGVVFKTVTFASPALTQVISGLANGTAYTFKVAAGNVAGVGLPTAASLAAVVGAPGPPRAVTVLRVASGSIKVTFTAPLVTNGAAITGYTATCASSNLGVTKTKTGTASPLTVTLLSPGKTYKCTVKASNSRGAGPASAASIAVTA